MNRRRPIKDAAPPVGGPVFDFSGRCGCADALRHGLGLSARSAFVFGVLAAFGAVAHSFSTLSALPPFAMVKANCAYHDAFLFISAQSWLVRSYCHSARCN